MLMYRGREVSGVDKVSSRNWGCWDMGSRGRNKAGYKERKKTTKFWFQNRKVVHDKPQEIQSKCFLSIQICLELNSGNRDRFATEGDTFPSKDSAIIRKFGGLIGF